MDTMLRQVFEALKEDTRNGDVVSLTNRDKIELEIYITDEDIAQISKVRWKKFVRKNVKESALGYLLKANNQKEKTKHILFK